MVARVISLIIPFGTWSIALAEPSGEALPGLWRGGEGAGFTLIQAEAPAGGAAEKAAPTSQEEPQKEPAKPPREAEPEAEPRTKPAVNVPRAKLFEQLGNEKYKERVEAQEALLAWGREDLDRGIETLYKTYREADDPEVRLRSREVLKRLVIIKQPFDGNGYLGIQMEPDQWQDGAGKIIPVVRIMTVRKGTAAEEAKLQADDLVTGVDNVVFNHLPTQAFADYIKEKRPGDTITLQVQRGDERLEIQASLRRRSPLLDRVTLWGSRFQLPDQAELDESDFREWLEKRAEDERARARRTD